MSQPVRVLLVDDHQMMRSGLRALLEEKLGVEVVAEASDGREGVRLAQQLSPDVVIMDINMPELNGIDATRQIRAEGHGPKVIALTGYAPASFVTEMLRAGASAYVLKTSAFEELGTALDSVRQGKVFVSAEIAPLIATADGQSTDGQHNAFTQLSIREREVLQLLAEGKATKEVASHLGVSVKTIETHRRNLMEKLDLYSVAELTKYAIRQGITSTDF
jgi:DNA-binding NarL/FixJ family response regulator